MLQTLSVSRFELGLSERRVSQQAVLKYGDARNIGFLAKIAKECELGVKPRFTVELTRHGSEREL